MNISTQKARKMVSSVGWNFIQQGKEWYSRDGKWIVYKVSKDFYRRKPAPQF